MRGLRRCRNRKQPEAHARPAASVARGAPYRQSHAVGCGTAILTRARRGGGGVCGGENRPIPHPGQSNRSAVNAWGTGLGTVLGEAACVLGRLTVS